MSGIVGIKRANQRGLVEGMLTKIAHRGNAGHEIMEIGGATLGISIGRAEQEAWKTVGQEAMVRDGMGGGDFAEAAWTSKGLALKRDPLGVAPLYYGHTGDGALCFASEVKALLGIVPDIHEFPPGYTYDDSGLQQYFQLDKQPELDEPVRQIAEELRRRLAVAVEKRIGNGEAGSWLSGGLDSSAIVALARPHLATFHTFAAGVPGASDLEHARAVADFVKSNHHEVVVAFQDMLSVLPKVIYHLESFDALLVRSSITNHLVARMASDYVPSVFSGEGGDELFAGYEYIKKIDPEKIADELVDITGRLHNTALQRVDRSAAAFGIKAHVPFLDPEVVDYALRIPVRYKLSSDIEKWILRRAMDGLLPEQVLRRTKAKFWEGAGVGEQMAEYAGQHVTDKDFQQERTLKNGWILNTKEELFYYRIFREHFGELHDLSWMGRTKGAPKAGMPE